MVVYSKLDILLQWEPEHYDAEKQHYSLFDVVRKPKNLISNLLNHLLIHLALV